MRKSLVAIAAAASSLLILSGCSTASDTATETAAPAASGSAAAAGTQTTTKCAPGDRIGVALPAQTSENWTLAKQLFEDQIKAAGFTPDVQFADSGSSAVASQQANADNMLTQQAKVLVIGAENGQQLGSQAEAAEAAGVPLIAYDRPIDAPATDYYVAFDNFKVGQLQGQALLDGMAKNQGDSPWNIELFAGAATDANAPVFFNGAMDVLQPKIDDGTLVVKSGQTSFDQVSTEGWKKANAQSRMENLITSNYSDGTPLAGVLSPNDQLAEGILNATSAAKLTPTVTGQDSEVVAVTRVAKGEQYSTIYKDTRKLVAETVKLITAVCAGDVYPTAAKFAMADVGSDSGVVIPADYLEPLIVTAENGAEVYKDNAELLKAFQAGQ
jgi:putative multiple sugar transport system substrate-binding protein